MKYAVPLIEAAIYAIRQNDSVTAIDLLQGVVNGKKASKFSCPQDIFLCYQWMNALEQEELLLLCLNSQNRILKEIRLFKGSVDSTIVSIRDILREAIRTNAIGIVLIHNHPSGEPNPSNEDKRLTTSVKLACQTVGITLVDHLIIGSEKYYSFMQERIL